MLVAGFACALLGRSEEARACGGFFVATTPDRPSVTTHRMAFSLSMTQTVLWDQIEYSGAPSEFAWVLPVKAGARLEVSRDAWFAALEASTQPVIYPPPDQSNRATSGGCAALGCGTSGSSPNATPPGTVQVVSQGVAGIYDTVTLHSTDSTSLQQWLTQNGYDVPQSIQPTLEAYVAGGFDFIALRLRPECGATAMQPVRIITDGADPTLPLRMVAAGVASGAAVGITLYVITEGRMHPQNFPDALIDYSRLTYDGTTGTSNYESLVTEAIASTNGFGWVTEFAGPAELQRGGTVASSAANEGLADAYFGACGVVGDAGPAPCLDAGGPASESGAPDADAEAADAAGDAGDAGDDAATADAADEAPAPAGPCPGFDDLDVALIGLQASDVWVTRLRSSLPVNALASGDLVLEATKSQTTVTNLHDAITYSDFSPGGAACESAPRLRDTAGTWTLIALGTLGTGALLRRRRKA